MRKWFIYAFLLLSAILTVSALGETISNDAHQANECSHQWRSFDMNQDRECLQYGYHAIEDDGTEHIRSVFTPEMICADCGAVSEQGSYGGFKEPHAMVVVNWDDTVQPDGVQVQWMCIDCSYQLEDVIPWDTLLGGSDQDCLKGGECAHPGDAYMSIDGRLVWGSPGVYGTDFVFFTRVVEEDGHYFLLSREYCIRCGRPTAVIVEDAHGRPEPRWAHVEIVAMTEFLRMDMQENLPFLLVDKLRETANAANGA